MISIKLQGIGYGHPAVHWPGLSKYLRQMSDRRWELGVQIYQKYVARGGQASDLITAGLFHFDGKVNHFISFRSKYRIT